MSTRAKLRGIGFLILLVNLWAIGRFDLGDVPTLLLTFGFAIAYEFGVVRGVPIEKIDARVEDEIPKVLALAAVCGIVVFASGGKTSSSPTEPIVERRPLMGCPSGYVDHPYDTEKCVLPAVAERYYRSRSSSHR